jgi:hypothetical protein
MNLNTPFVEGLKQLGRVALMSIVPLVIAGLQDNSLNWRAIAVAGAIAILMGIDKWLHKNDAGLGGNGLTGF